METEKSEDQQMDRLERSRLLSEIATLRQLLGVNEATAVEQVERADRALAAMRASAQQREEQVRMVGEIMEASSDAVLVLDEHSIIRYRNARARAAAVQDAFVDGGAGDLERLYPRLAAPAFRERFETAMRGRVSFAFEAADEAHEHWFEVNVSPVGEGIAIYFRDVTDRHKQQALLARSEKLAVVGRLASSISHEINNPLESVVNLLYLIEHSASAGDEMRTYAKLATSELARVSHIVTQTLKFHRQSVRAEAARASEILDSVVSLFQGRLATLQVRVDRRFAPADTMVCLAGDMRQVFANLIGNAMDALGGAGTISLRTRLSRDWRTGARGLRVTVADNGAGMSDATRRRIFEAFYTTKTSTGTGLGLWVSQEIIRNHRGRVQVRSSQRAGASGTVFSLFFPAEIEGSIES
ncbi:His Kinase A (phospho-acceptor) domain-containing protein [Granulicella rosea]|uniref:histidine kinase n=1 Tax=Granulicella rosea TaxID=474952 RepID=A0A239LAC9_9BACT|nr:ATP-binding protein [Granulicella rosea]SNT27240.1 His Kinase A (phospho-acceptor) domain-containing protein [Granulicella rosea]